MNSGARQARSSWWMLFCCLLPVVACKAPAVEEPHPETVSLLGQPLHPPEMAADTKARREGDLAAARAAHDEDPTDPDRIIWLGRRYGYLWQYRAAIEVFDRGVELHPGDARMYRHRGHRQITVRDFDRAVADLEQAVRLIDGRADEIEPDGAPNEFGIPRSTLNSNVWYHLGLAYYLKGDFESALRCYLECMEFATVNDDMLVATSDWLYMTYRRLGRDDEARAVLEPIHEDMEILENHAYHRRLLMYKGRIDPETLLDPVGMTELDLATQGYGVANWYFYNGDTERALALMRRVVDGEYWSAFGQIAAEADLARLGERRGPAE